MTIFALHQTSNYRHDSTMAEVRNVGIILFEEFEELDAVGPLEVFSMSSKVLDMVGDKSKPQYRPITITVPGNEGGRTVRGGGGMQVLADYAGDDPELPALDIVLVPGGPGTRALQSSTIVPEWLAKICAQAAWVTSVCTGVLLLYSAGIAKGKQVATHFMFEDKLEEYKDVTVVRGERWVVDGSLVTCQGVSAGIDMSLWLIGQLHSPEHALQTQKIMQYNPAPPYQDLKKPADGEK